MEIKKSSIFCKVAYALKDDNKIPSNANLCRLGWRFLFMLFVIPVLFVVGGCFVILVYAVGFFFAARPTIFEGDSIEMPMVRYARWPRIKGVRVYPIWVVAILLMLVYFTVLAEFIANAASFMIHFRDLWTGIAIGLAIVIAAVAVAITTKASRKSETYKIFKEFLKATKQKIKQKMCPVVRIVE